MTREVNRIVIHCSDSPDARDIGFHEIDQWHKERGWSGILYDGIRIHCGYHYIIRRGGVVELGRPEDSMGAHAKGHNRDTIAICWVGKNLMDELQWESMVTLLKDICSRYLLDASDLYGHYELDPKKTCPNIDMKELRTMMGKLLGEKTWT